MKKRWLIRLVHIYFLIYFSSPLLRSLVLGDCTAIEALVQIRSRNLALKFCRAPGPSPGRCFLAPRAPSAQCPCQSWGVPDSGPASAGRLPRAGFRGPASAGRLLRAGRMGEGQAANARWPLRPNRANRCGQVGRGGRATPGRTGGGREGVLRKSLCACRSAICADGGVVSA